MKQLLIAVLLLFSSMGYASSVFPEFFVLEKEPLNLFQFASQNIIHETESSYILASSLTNFESYDYYFLQKPPQVEIQQAITMDSHVVLEHEDFYILQIGNKNQLYEVAELAHRGGHFCGMLQKLLPNPISLTENDSPDVFIGERPEVRKATEITTVENIIETMKTMVSWKTRFEGDPEGKLTGNRLKEMYESLIPQNRPDVTVELVDHQGTEQKSILVRIMGQTRPKDIIILGSHIDSINQSDKSDSPGADDNASGTGTNMEVFRVLMESDFRPQATIEIHGYAAEEIGLVGSKEMAAEYKQNNVNVQAMVQFDMNAYAENGDKITFVTNNTNRQLTRQLMDLAKIYNDIPTASGFLLFGSSDHAAWNSQGFPVAFPTEDPFGFNDKIHTKDDTLAETNSPRQIHEFAKLGVAYLMHFSE